MQPSRGSDKSRWRPSEANKARLASLSGEPTRPRRSAFRSVSLALALLLLFVFVYVYLKLWRDRNLQGLHTPLAILGGAIALLLIVAVAARRLRPKKRDDKSVLHL